MDKISAYPNIKFMVSESNWMNANTTRSGNLGHGPMLSLLQPRVLNTFSYEFYNYSFGNVWYPPLLPSDALGAGNIDPKINGDWLTNKNSYNAYLQEKVFGDKFTSINNLHRQGSYIYQVALAKTGIINNSPSTLLYITPQIQGEMYINKAEYLENIREPLNEEIEAQTMLALSHGADGLINYIFQSKHWQASQPMNFHNMNQQAPFPTTSTDFYTYGLYGRLSDSEPKVKRDSNLYNQDKWAFMKKMNAKINKWIPTLDKITWQNGFSVHSEGAAHYFINNIQSLYATTNGGTPICQEDNIWADCNNERYWEEGFFSPINTSDNSKYFLMTNRRCAPEVAPIYLGDIRQLKINFSSSQLSGFNNWKIINVENDSLINTFDKNSTAYVDMGIFQPGEGRLYKLAPVMTEGGTLVADETCSGTFNCNGKVLNNGHNITISPSTTISFSDSAGIEMNGGNFTCGLNTQNITPVTLTGKTGSTYWNGLSLSNCSSIEIYNTNISKITSDTAKAVLITNCKNININNTSFNMGSNAGAIQAVYTEIPDDEPAAFNVGNCSFNMGSSSYSAISIISNASSSLPVIIDWCTFSTTNENANAITLSGVTGGAIKNSTFTNFVSTFNTLSSTIDLYNNTILGRTNSTGILCVDGSSISLSQSSGLYLGGYNYIRNYGGSSSNICSDNSLFNINNGGNNFDLDNIDNSKHFNGNFGGMPYLNVNAMKNCFHIDSITNIDALHSVVWNGTTDPVNLLFTPYICELTKPNDFFVYQYSGYNDTVYYRAGGEGSGFNPNKQISIEENVYKSLKDTININLRKRNYLTVEDKAKLLLTQFPDSLENIGMVQKLYMASLSLDSTKIGITKIFLENLIAANTQNPSLIKRAFYFIQKCKVKLGQYQSALDGFQYIMIQNPYTYEGLVAAWDYAATYLLMGTGGSYKGDYEEQTEELNTPPDTLLNRMTKRDINTSINTNIKTSKNTSKNNTTTSTEQITKTFYKKVKIVTKDDKSTQEAKVKTLEKTIETSKNKTEKNDAVKELAKMKQIKETIKIKKPTTVNVHISMMNDDIKKVFGIGKKSSNETTNNLIPQTYTLYQNYPNPFNPVTKIAYDIPKDAKVKLVIYDILGREMKTLVNNEFRSAGKYITEFNGSNLASGIYFARILVNEGKDFISVKKMVLLK
ncbi:MAG: T9SS type A sorting domain-containing protein [Ignavibacteriota bacterium]